ncbi:MAG: hypothetical protein IT204_11720 [Fimbriimonadaceae bacterium]|nr:hypothetical protein [Fimbriimonadaceae bacterium]
MIASMLLLANLAVEPLPPRVGPRPRPALEVGQRRELFVDAALIDGFSGSARRVLHHPVPANAALTLDGAAEGPTSAYFTVLRDGDLVRLYYRGQGGEAGREVTCYAESRDGLLFTKPALGLVEHAGSKANNIVWAGAGTHNFSPFLDSRPGCPPEERYKAVGGGPLLGFVSPDGLHWRLLRPEPILTKGAFDSHNVAFWDPTREQYVCYFRTFKDGVRWITRATSPDFRTWSEPVDLTFGDALPEHLYTNNIVPYDRAPHLLLGIPARFLPDRRKDPQHPVPGISDAVLLASRDGLAFERWREAFLRPGPDPLSWTDRTNYPAWGIIQTSPTELSIYWTEHYRHPDLKLRRGTLRLDGFVSVGADMSGGELLTAPFTFTGRRLLVNYATSAAGSLRFELCDEAGEPLLGLAYADSELLYGDELQHAVTWQGGDLASQAARPVRLRVALRDADLYSLRFAE